MTASDDGKARLALLEPTRRTVAHKRLAFAAGRGESYSGCTRYHKEPVRVGKRT